VAVLVDATGTEVYDGAAVLSDGTARNCCDLAKYIQNPSVPGYKRMLDMGRVLFHDQDRSFEMNFCQPKLIGLGGGKSVIFFTTFEP
jgi:hypothetical protein